MNSKRRRTTRTLWRKGSRGGLCLMLLFGLLSAAGGRLAYADATVTTWTELTSAFANAASGSIITLGAGIEQSSGSLSFPSGRSLILDLAGNRLAVHAGSGSTSAAVHVPVGATLTIRDSGVNGTLIADAAGGYGAGIGGNYQETAGTIVIDSGNVTATGQSAAGIGGGSFGGSGGTTIINGGNVTALSTGGGAGIGSGIKNGSEGNAGAGGTIIINGGNVSATGTYGGAGIGGAYQSPGVNVTITAGVVTVSGSGSGSAIGGTPFGSLYNSGQIQVAGGSQITIPADASVTNNGTISGAISGSEHMGGNNFTISFDWNGVPQSNPASIQIYTTSLAAAGKTLPSLSRAGYIWEGWYTEAEGGEQVTETSTITSSLTLYAHTISDPVPPSVQLMSSVGSGTKGPFMVTAKFSEAVSGFADGDVTVTNGTVGPISGSGDTYTFLVTPVVEGTVTVRLASGIAEDAAGNGNAASTDLVLTYDHTLPTVTLTTPAGIFTNEPFTVTAKFSEAVSGFADGDVTVTNGTVGAITGSGDTYTFQVTPTADGSVTVQLAADVAADAAGNGNAAATDLALTYDHTLPTVTLTTSAGNFTNEPFTVTAKFSEEVNGFTDGDVTVTNGTVGALAGSGDTFTFPITPTADGQVTVSVYGDAAVDAAGNGNTPATDLVLTYDHTPPTVTLTTTAGNFTNEPFMVTAKFSEEVSGFTDGDVTVTNSTAGAITGSGDAYTFLVTPEADSLVTVAVYGDVAMDASGNGNIAGAVLSLIYDRTAASIAFSPNGSPDPAATVETTVVVTDEASSNLKSLKYMWTQSTDAPEEHAVGWSDFTTGDTIRQTEGEGVWYLHIHAVDETGNVNDRVSEPFVLDNTAPSIELIGDNPFYVPQGDSYLEPGATSTDNFDGVLPASSIMINGDVDTEALGLYEIHYAARDRAGNEATVTRSVYVYDGDMPIIHLNGSNPLIVAVGSVFADPGATAWDKQEGDLTGAITVTGAVYTAGVSWYHLDYRVKDNAGNAAPTVTRAVYVIAPPVITLLGSSAVTMMAGEAFSDPGAHASDDYYGDLTGAIAVTGTVDIHRPGLYTLQYNVQNPIGQQASATR
ncbi:immunoglobulin-like domain-containing protein [Paenibacillus sp. TAB 01]|uniref:immunoglobulin-like domain-containing protein n=1 Tax=Paenibacillus sp. TAB 01 TaxID=3368988 RepID=UPI0037523BDF